PSLRGAGAAPAGHPLERRLPPLRPGRSRADALDRFAARPRVLAPGDARRAQELVELGARTGRDGRAAEPVPAQAGGDPRVDPPTSRSGARAHGGTGVSG